MKLSLFIFQETKEGDALIKLFCCIFLSLLFCGCETGIASDIITDPPSDNQLIGTWIIYAGGNVAPDVLRFENGGVGTAFKLPPQYDEAWLDGGGLDEDILTEIDRFHWALERIDEEQGILQITFQTWHNEMEYLNYQIFFIEDMDNTSLPGFELCIGESGGAWLKVPIDMP